MGDLCGLVVYTVSYMCFYLNVLQRGSPSSDVVLIVLIINRLIYSKIGNLLYFPSETIKRLIKT